MDTAAVQDLAVELASEAEAKQFSGVIRLESDTGPVLELASGDANRAEASPITMRTRMATASGTKGFTALTVVSLIGDGLIDFRTRLRDLLEDELPNVDEAVTIEHLLAHTSGAGDYLDEELAGDIDDHVLEVPVHRLERPADYLPLLVEHPQRWRPGERFAYNNSGYVMLARAVERATGSVFHTEVRRRVFEPAGMSDSDFLRSDRLPASVALGYLANGHTNVFHLPVIGCGDGGAFTTAPDMIRFWHALKAGEIVDADLVRQMTTPPSPHLTTRYGLGFWLSPGRATVHLEGIDAGVSFRSGADMQSNLRYCIIANDARGVWPLAEIVDRHLSPET